MLRYKIFSPIRLLLPFSCGMFVIPFFFHEKLLYMTLPFSYFIGAYCFFINFPYLAERMHKRPFYLEDLTIAHGDVMDKTFQQWYSFSMSFILAMLFASFSEYIVLQGIRDKPIVEIIGIIGGNLSIYMKAQQVLGKLMISICHILKQRKETKTKYENKIIQL